MMKKVSELFFLHTDIFIFLLIGAFFGFFINNAILPLDYSNIHNFIYLFSGVLVLVFGFLITRILKFTDLSWFRKARLFILGAAFISLASAGYTYFTYVQYIYVNNAALISGTIFVSILKSLLLASLFSFIERSLKFLEDQKKESHYTFDYPL